MTVSNPYETIEPSSTYEALRDTTRYLETLMPRDKVIEFISELDPSRIALSLLGQFVEPPLSSPELVMATTAEHYGRQFRDGPVGLVTAIAALQNEVKDGGVFIGEPVPAHIQQ